MIEISTKAQIYLAELLEKQGVSGIAIRAFVSQPGTPQAETCIVYCKPGEEELTDKVVQYEHIKAFIDQESLPFLEDATIEYVLDDFGGQLTIKAPHAKTPKISNDGPLNERINYILQTEINPALAAHGGMITLVELTDDNIAVLQFGGGCQGCGMADVTLKQGVEKTLFERFPELTEVRDVTDHNNRTNAYY